MNYIDKKMEEFADLEHQRWSKWQKYMHSKLQRSIEDKGFMRLPDLYFTQWERQINTPYSELTEKEKESDREQVRPYIEALKQALEEQRESIKKDLVDEIEKYVFNLYDSIHKETGAYKYDWVVEAMEKAILQIINEKMK
jgi:hypothetical protein